MVSRFLLQDLGCLSSGWHLVTEEQARLGGNDGFGFDTPVRRLGRSLWMWPRKKEKDRRSFWSCGVSTPASRSLQEAAQPQPTHAWREEAAGAPPGLRHP